MDRRITGAFSATELSADYSGSSYGFARRIGEGLAACSDRDWPEVERALRDLWNDPLAQLPWVAARPAIYLAWLTTRRVIGAEKKPRRLPGGEN